MWRYYLRTAWIGLNKHRLYSVLSLLSLVVGLACSLFIHAWIEYEKSYDTFHTKAGRTVLFQNEEFMNGDYFKYSYTKYPVRDAIKATYNDIEETVSFVDGNFKIDFFESPLCVFASDDRFLDIFDFPLLYGKKGRLLGDPESVVLSCETAEKIFGKGVNPVGRVLKAKKETYKVAGVLKPIPENTAFHFDMLVNLDHYTRNDYKGWNGGVSFKLFLLLREGVQSEKLERQINPKDYHPKQYHDELATDGNPLKIRLMPLLNIHTQTEGYTAVSSDVISKKYLELFRWVSIVVLLLSVIVFINLTVLTQKSFDKELGIRKVMGAETKHVLAQQLFSTAVVYGVALLGTLILLEVISPFLFFLTGKEFSIYHVLSWQDYAGGCMLLAILVVLSSGYPVWSQRRKNSVSLIRSKAVEKAKKFTLSNGLTVFQLAVSVAIAVSTLVVYGQFRFMLSKSKGSNFETTVCLLFEKGGEAPSEKKAFQKAVDDLPMVKMTEFSNAVFQGDHCMDGYGFRQLDGEYEYVYPQVRYCEGEDFLKMFDIQVIEGRGFNDELETDDNKILVNEAFLRYWNWTEALGKTISRNRREFEIIGIVKDFHMKGLQEEIQPLVIRKDESPRKYARLSMKLHRSGLLHASSEVKRVFKKFFPLGTFNLEFISSRAEVIYSKEKKLLQFFSVFSFISIVISMLGVFSLTGLTLRERDKEVAVRKTYGAEAHSLIWMLCKRYAYLLLVSFALAVPFLFWYLSQWLSGYAYHISLSAWPFFGGMILLVLCVALTVAYHVWELMKVDPAEALKTE